MVVLLTFVVLDQYYRYKTRNLLSGGCGFYVWINYKYPDADIWTHTQRLGPFKSEAFANKVVEEFQKENDPTDSIRIRVEEDCPQY